MDQEVRYVSDGVPTITQRNPHDNHSTDSDSDNYRGGDFNLSFVMDLLLLIAGLVDFQQVSLFGFLISRLGEAMVDWLVVCAYAFVGVLI